MSGVCHTAIHSWAKPICKFDMLDIKNSSFTPSGVLSLAWMAQLGLSDICPSPNKTFTWLPYVSLQYSAVDWYISRDIWLHAKLVSLEWLFLKATVQAVRLLRISFVKLCNATSIIAFGSKCITESAYSVSEYEEAWLTLFTYMPLTLVLTDNRGHKGGRVTAHSQGICNSERWSLGWPLWKM